MDQVDKYLTNIATTYPIEANVTVDYHDDDIVMIDNVKLFAEPKYTRMQMNVVAFCHKGKMQVDINGKTTLFHENQLLLCPPQFSFSNFMMSPDFEFKAIFMTNKILQSFLREKMNVWMEQLYVYKVNVLDINPEHIDILNKFYDFMRLGIDFSDDNPYKADIVQSMLRGALLMLCGMLKVSMDEQRTSPGSLEMLHDVAGVKRSSQTVFQQFIDLLGKSTVKHRSVADYAKQLYITPKYLSYICKKNSGKSAIEWIREYTMEDIRFYLQQTDYSIKQICDQIGFPNPSFFGKYVKEHFGVTPSKLR